MFNRVAYKIQFKIERFLLRGAGHQLFFIAFLIFMVALVGGIIVFIGTESFSTIFEAIWWGFLRLSDPGYLGDDEGLLCINCHNSIRICSVHGRFSSNYDSVAK